MNTKKLILAGILAASIALPAAVRAERLEINVGDRPFHSHGDRFWEGDYEMIWVPGHESHGHWIHGHYRRGEHHRHHGMDHHDRDDRHDDRHDDGDRH